MELICEAIARTAATGAGGVAALDHEIGDHAVEDGAIVETLARQEDEIVDRLGRFIGEKSDGDVAFIGVEDGGVALLGVEVPFRGCFDHCLVCLP